jgi:hypothetical protein
MKTTEAWPDRRWHDSRLESEFTCFDEDKPGRKSASHWDTQIGIVHQAGGGPGGGMWLWSVTATLPGPRFPGITSGREISRKEAGRCVVECYEHMLKFYGKYGSGDR